METLILNRRTNGGIIQPLLVRLFHVRHLRVGSVLKGSPNRP